MKKVVSKYSASAIRWLLAVMLFLLHNTAWSQNPTDEEPGDPGALSVTTIQHMNFGAFALGASGGTITIATNGSRSVTGTVIPMNVGVMFYQAIFEISSPQGSIVSIINGPDAKLTGSNGGSMTMRLGNSLPASPFMIVDPQPTKTLVHVSGTLTVGTAAANPPGVYSGTFYITFNQE